MLHLNRMRSSQIAVEAAEEDNAISQEEESARQYNEAYKLARKAARTDQPAVLDLEF